MVLSLFLKASKIFRSIVEMLGNLRVIRKSLMKSWESSEVFGLVNSWAVWPLTTTFGVLGVLGCPRGVPGMFRGVSGCSGVFQVLQTPDEFWLFLTRVRLRLFDHDLVFRFNISISTVSEIVITWRNKLFVMLGRLPIWLSKEVMKSTFPKYLKEGLKMLGV